jgi:hypothetical protein
MSSRRVVHPHFHGDRPLMMTELLVEIEIRYSFWRGEHYTLLSEAEGM